QSVGSTGAPSEREGHEQAEEDGDRSDRAHPVLPLLRGVALEPHRIGPVGRGGPAPAGAGGGLSSCLLGGRGIQTTKHKESPTAPAGCAVGHGERRIVSSPESGERIRQRGPLSGRSDQRTPYLA